MCPIDGRDFVDGCYLACTYTCRQMVGHLIQVEGQAIPSKMSDSPSINDAEVSQKQQTTSPVKSFLSGAAGGVSCVLVGHPFDLTKTRLQTAAKGEYRGAMDVVRRTLAQDGIKG